MNENFHWSNLLPAGFGSMPLLAQVADASPPVITSAVVLALIGLIGSLAKVWIDSNARTLKVQLELLQKERESDRKDFHDIKDILQALSVRQAVLSEKQAIHEEVLVDLDTKSKNPDPVKD